MCQEENKTWSRQQSITGQLRPERPLGEEDFIWDLRGDNLLLFWRKSISGKENLGSKGLGNGWVWRFWRTRRMWGWLKRIRLEGDRAGEAWEGPGHVRPCRLGAGAGGRDFNSILSVKGQNWRIFRREGTWPWLWIHQYLTSDVSLGKVLKLAKP